MGVRKDARAARRHEDVEALCFHCLLDEGLLLRQGLRYQSRGVPALIFV